MLAIFEAHSRIFRTWQVVRYDQTDSSHILHATAVLRDGSRLQIRDYGFEDGSRKYAYQWMEPDGNLRRRWDDAPHWPALITSPHHVHMPNAEQPLPSTVTNLENLMSFLTEWFEK